MSLAYLIRRQRVYPPHLLNFDVPLVTGAPCLRLRPCCAHTLPATRCRSSLTNGASEGYVCLLQHQVCSGRACTLYISSNQQRTGTSTEQYCTAPAVSIVGTITWHAMFSHFPMCRLCLCLMSSFERCHQFQAAGAKPCGSVEWALLPKSVLTTHVHASHKVWYSIM